MPQTERLTITVGEFAKIAGISRHLAYELARQDRLPVPVIRLGRRMLLSRSKVGAILGQEVASLQHPYQNSSMGGQTK